MAECWQKTRQGITLRIKANPGASQNRLAGFFTDADGTVSLKIMTTTQAEKGKANKAVIAILSKAFKQPKSTFKIINGTTSRQKTVLLCGDEATILDWLLPPLRELS